MTVFVISDCRKKQKKLINDKMFTAYRSPRLLRVIAFNKQLDLV